MVTAVHRTTTLVTAEQLMELDADGGRRELWEGEVVDVSPAGGPHGFIIRRLSRIIDDFAIDARLGQAWAGESGYVIGRNPDVVVAPDIALVRLAYVKRVTLDSEGYHDYLPPLVIEVKSPTDREKDIQTKLGIYLRAGLEEIWLVRPKARTVTRHRADADPEQLKPGDTLHGGSVLPGFALPIDHLFAASDS